MFKTKYVSPRCGECELDLDTAVLAGSLQDYEVDPFDFGDMMSSQQFPNQLLVFLSL